METQARISFQRQLACFHASLPHPHQPECRRIVEVYSGWAILTHDRERDDYREHYENSRTPVQLLKLCPKRGAISLLTPSLLTDKRIHLFVGGERRAYCCYRCAYEHLWAELDVLLP